MDGNVADAVINEGVTTYPNTTAAIAATHSIFNVVNTLIFLPFLPYFVGLLQRMVPAKDFKEKPRLTDLDIRILETPALAIDQSSKEIERMADGCQKMMGWLGELLQQEEPDEEMGDRLRHRERVLDTIQDEVSEFITGLLAGNVPHAVADEARRQLRIADEYESVSDYLANIEKFDRKLRKDGYRFTKVQLEGLADLNHKTSEFLTSINEGLRLENRAIMMKSKEASKRIRADIKELRKGHLDAISSGEIAPLVSVAYLAALNAYSRVRDHAFDIAEIISSGG
jgi:phosphate:Na+ symporter